MSYLIVIETETQTLVQSRETRGEAERLVKVYRIVEPRNFRALIYQSGTFEEVH